jgi:hypothetical protein
MCDICYSIHDLFRLAVAQPDNVFADGLQRCAVKWCRKFRWPGTPKREFFYLLLINSYQRSPDVR